MLRDLSDLLLAGWDRFFPHQPKPKRMFFLNVNGSLEGGTTTFLVFADRQSTPIWAIKVEREPDTESLLREEKVLEGLRQASPQIAHSVPVVASVTTNAGRTALALSIVPGEPMPATLGVDGFPPLSAARAALALASEWLIALHRSTRNRDKTNQTGLR